MIDYLFSTRDVTSRGAFAAFILVRLLVDLLALLILLDSIEAIAASGATHLYYVLPAAVVCYVLLTSYLTNVQRVRRHRDIGNDIPMPPLLSFGSIVGASDIVFLFFAKRQKH